MCNLLWPVTVMMEIWASFNVFFSLQPEREPPSHMKICQGPVKSRNLKKGKKNSHQSYTECLLCSGYITSPESKLTCLNSECELVCHIICLSKLFLEPSEFVPLEGLCPFCGTNLKWGDLIRKMKGCAEVPRSDVFSQDDEQGDDEDVLSQDRGFVDNNSVWLQECDDL